MTGKELKELRTQLGLSQQEVADMAFCTKQNISNVELEHEHTSLKRWCNYLELLYKNYIETNSNAIEERIKELTRNKKDIEYDIKYLGNLLENS